MVLGLDNVVAMARSPKILDIFLPKTSSFNFLKKSRGCHFLHYSNTKTRGPEKKKNSYPYRVNPEPTIVLVSSKTMNIFFSK